MTNIQGLCRAIIAAVDPEIDHGQFPIKRTVGESVIVQADVFGDGHDVVHSVLLYRQAGEETWSETALTPLVNDRRQGTFTVTQVGRAEYTIVAWVDQFLTWLRDLKKRSPMDADIEVNLQVGEALILAAAKRATGETVAYLREQAATLVSKLPITERVEVALAPELSERMEPLADRRMATRYPLDLAIVVDRVKARFSTWYELFPRSWSRDPGKHGTFADVEWQLPRIAQMGFDILYLPPIHPIGTAFRKGKNNSPSAELGEVGSPWGIGSAEGGHDAIHPELGTLKDFQRLISKAHDQGIDIALDIAYQCSPDHPWVREHPSWFRERPDGSIQYAENPPKKYQDIYPIDFESEDWRGLWRALADVVFYWIKQGVTIFRVDNPHTKAFPFWDWMIGEVKAKHPEVIFLSEAFTRPKVMYRLAKGGFTQSYTYFSWRNTKSEIMAYFNELTQTEVREYFRPNLWPNTPDILPEFLQWSGRPGFMMRLILAATLGASYGIYGAAYELCVSDPVAPGKEEYLNSEKYQITQWKLGGPNDLSEFIARMNRIRHENPALQSDHTLTFHPTDNPEIICYSKTDQSSGNKIVALVNLDPRNAQSGWVDLAHDTLEIDGARPYQMEDLLAGGHYLWHGGRNYVSLDPKVVPGHVFRLKQHMRSEQDFDYFQ